MNRNITFVILLRSWMKYLLMSKTLRLYSLYKSLDLFVCTGVDTIYQKYTTKINKRRSIYASSCNKQSIHSVRVRPGQENKKRQKAASPPLDTRSARALKSNTTLQIVALEKQTLGIGSWSLTELYIGMSTTICYKSLKEIKRNRITNPYWSDTKNFTVPAETLKLRET